MLPELKNRISHRGQAAKQLCQFLKNGRPQTKM
jgi:inosine/xanthosine triphosphate pyrophosphatase family protein